ncbi:SIT4 phosphatase-associated protein-domain-containing protein [Zopfochytrium polystomum]|nr:SIT4 phosphatase-associated protein-domain-containing protein [Zopfochytrium polystomum]
MLTNSELDDAKKYKYPYLACEVISCEILTVCDGLVADIALLNTFWTFLDRPAPIDPLQASYFSKVNGILMQKKVAEVKLPSAVATVKIFYSYPSSRQMIEFVRNQPDVVKRMLQHIANASIAELLLKIISVEELPEAQGIVGWLCAQGLIPQLIDRLEPSLDIEIHNTASQTILDIIAVSYQNIAAQEAAIAAGEAVSTEGSTSLVDQLKSAPIIKKLVGFMLDKEAPNASSTLANGINIIIEIIRRYCSEIEQAEYQQHQFQQQMISPRTGNILPTEEKVRILATDLNDLLHALGDRVEEMAVLLDNPRTEPFFTAVAGDVVPLGSERLKTCELFAEILHLQYLYYSSPLFDRLVESSTSTQASAPSPASTATLTAPAPAPLPSDPTSTAPPSVSDEGSEVTARKLDSSQGDVDALAAAVSRMQVSAQTNVADELVAVTDKFVRSRILPMCLKLFFDFPWNNFLHSVVYDMIAKVFNTYSYTSTTSYARPLPQPEVDGSEDPPAAAAAAAAAAFASASPDGLEAKMVGVKASFKALVLSILVEGKLSALIIDAQTRNDAIEKEPRGTRLGFMGHLTYIADEICKLLEKCGADFEGDTDTAGTAVVHPDWDAYVNGVLRETKERDRQLLGGARPAQLGAPHVPVAQMNPELLDALPAGMGSGGPAVAASGASGTAAGGDSGDASSSTPSAAAVRLGEADGWSSGINFD